MDFSKSGKSSFTYFALYLKNHHFIHRHLQQNKVYLADKKFLKSDMPQDPQILNKSQFNFQKKTDAKKHQF